MRSPRKSSRKPPLCKKSRLGFDNCVRVLLLLLKINFSSPGRRQPYREALQITSFQEIQAWLGRLSSRTTSAIKQLPFRARTSAAPKRRPCETPVRSTFSRGFRAVIHNANNEVEKPMNEPGTAICRRIANFMTMYEKGPKSIVFHMIYVS